MNNFSRSNIARIYGVQKGWLIGRYFNRKTAKQGEVVFAVAKASGKKKPILELRVQAPLLKGTSVYRGDLSPWNTDAVVEDWMIGALIESAICYLGIYRLNLSLSLSIREGLSPSEFVMLIAKGCVFPFVIGAADSAVVYDFITIREHWKGFLTFADLAEQYGMGPIERVFENPPPPTPSEYPPFEHRDSTGVGRWRGADLEVNENFIGMLGSSRTYLLALLMLHGISNINPSEITDYVVFFEKGSGKPAYVLLYGRRIIDLSNRLLLEKSTPFEPIDLAGFFRKLQEISVFAELASDGGWWQTDTEQVDQMPSPPQIYLPSYQYRHTPYHDEMRNRPISDDEEEDDVDDEEEDDVDDEDDLECDICGEGMDEDDSYTCDHCGNRVCEDCYYSDDSMVICANCREDLFQRCFICDQFVLELDAENTTAGRSAHRECIEHDNRWTYCDKCGLYYSTSGTHQCG